MQIADQAGPLSMHQNGAPTQSGVRPRGANVAAWRFVIPPRSSTMTRSRLQAAIFCAAWGASAIARAQQTADQATAQQRYDRAIAQCNDANLPRPERDACVRDAGRALDRVRGGG